jgi:hypothetical protein
MQKDMNEYDISDHKTWPAYRRGQSPVVFRAKQVNGRHWVTSGNRLRRTTPGDYLIHNGAGLFIEQADVFEKNYVRNIEG